MIRHRLAQALKEENRKTRRRLLKLVVVVIGALYLALNLTCAYPVFGWHPYACLCDVCLTQYDDERETP
jgi:hypothetical protein